MKIVGGNRNYVTHIAEEVGCGWSFLGGKVDLVGWYKLHGKKD